MNAGAHLCHGALETAPQFQAVSPKRSFLSACTSSCPVTVWVALLTTCVGFFLLIHLHSPTTPSMAQRPWMISAVLLGGARRNGWGTGGGLYVDSLSSRHLGARACHRYIPLGSDTPRREPVTHLIRALSGATRQLVLNACTRKHTITSMHTCMHACMHTHTHTRMFAPMRTLTHMHACLGTSVPPMHAHTPQHSHPPHLSHRWLSRPPPPFLGS